MASCCGETRVEKPIQLELVCPACGDSGRTVNNITIQSLVREIPGKPVGEKDYNICMSADCDIVYYNRDGFFEKNQLTVPVNFKEPDNAAPVCYCYNLKEEDIVNEMRKNYRARSFAEVQAVFGMDNCSCEKNHPRGGNCACSAEVGRAVKKGLKDNIVLEFDRENEKMKKVFIFERNEDCCGPSQAEPLVSFLERKMKDKVQVRIFDLAKEEEFMPIPPELIEKMQVDGHNCLPAVVIDGVLVKTGELPNYMDAVELLNS